MTACWRALTQIDGVDLTVIAFKPPGQGSAAPFSEKLMGGLDFRFLTEAETADEAMIGSLVESLNPDVVSVAAWLLPAYTRLPQSTKLSGKKFIMTMDTPFRGDYRQRLARLKLASFLRRMDRVIVPGERAWQYARYLGFPENKVRRGMYGIDFDAFAPMYDQRLAENNSQWPRRFLYMGRYAEEKSIEVLVEAYRLYCKQISDPWPLTTCGAGEKKHLFENVPNLTDRGFVQPVDQPAVWASHGAFVIASRYDPWPLVIVEACAAGLPILCTESCGSSVELVRQYYNGTSVATDDPQSLANGMLWIHRNHDKCPQMGQRSQQFASAYSAQAWATRMLQLCKELT